MIEESGIRRYHWSFSRTQAAAMPNYSGYGHGSEAGLLSVLYFVVRVICSIEGGDTIGLIQAWIFGSALQQLQQDTW